MRLGVIDMGTRCDWNLTITVVKSLLEKNIDVIYMTADDNKMVGEVASMKGVEVIVYKPISKEITNDPEMINRLAATHVPLEDKMVEGLPQWRWLKGELRDDLTTVWDKIDGLVVHYPALTYLHAIPRSKLDTMRICVFYVGPAYPNIDTPWIFSQRLQDPDYKLRSDNVQRQLDNYQSSLNFWTQMSGIWWAPGYMDLAAYMKKALILASWDPVYLPPTRPLPSAPKEYNVVQTGAIIDLKGIVANATEPADPELVSWVNQAAGNILYVSTGSFEAPYYDLLTAFIDNSSMMVLFHDNKGASKPPKDGEPEHKEYAVLQKLRAERADRILIRTDFIAHEWIVPRCAAIVTTGSTCLVNICLYHAKPLIIVPIITEQYFWGKNYKQQAGVPYVDLKRGSIKTQVAEALAALRDPRVSVFSAKVQSSIKTSGGGVSVLADEIIKFCTPTKNPRVLTLKECSDMKIAIDRIKQEMVLRKSYVPNGTAPLIARPPIHVRTAHFVSRPSLTAHGVADPKNERTVDPSTFKVQNIWMHSPEMPVRPYTNGISVVPKGSIIYTGSSEPCAGRKVTDKRRWFAAYSTALAYAGKDMKNVAPCRAVRDLHLFNLLDRGNIEELMRREQDPEVREAIIFSTGMGDNTPRPGAPWEKFEKPFPERCATDFSGETVCAQFGWSKEFFEWTSYFVGSHPDTSKLLYKKDARGQWVLHAQTWTGYRPVDVRTSLDLGTHRVGYEAGSFMRSTSTKHDGMILASIQKHFPTLDGYYCLPTITLRNPYGILFHEEIALHTMVGKVEIDCSLLSQRGGDGNDGYENIGEIGPEWPTMFRE
jgi:hypothetical protein